MNAMSGHMEVCVGTCMLRPVRSYMESDILLLYNLLHPIFSNVNNKSFVQFIKEYLLSSPNVY